MQIIAIFINCVGILQGHGRKWVGSEFKWDQSHLKSRTGDDSQRSSSSCAVPLALFPAQPESGQVETRLAHRQPPISTLMAAQNWKRRERHSADNALNKDALKLLYDSKENFYSVQSIIFCSYFVYTCMNFCAHGCGNTEGGGNNKTD